MFAAAAGRIVDSSTAPKEMFVGLIITVIVDMCIAAAFVAGAFYLVFRRREPVA